MERKDVMSKNVAIYKAQASALEKHAAPGCKVRRRHPAAARRAEAEGASRRQRSGCWGRGPPARARPACQHFWGVEVLAARSVCLYALRPPAPPWHGHSSHSLLTTRACDPLQVLVVANPANTNSLILKENAPSIPAGAPAAACFPAGNIHGHQPVLRARLLLPFFRAH